MHLIGLDIGTAGCKAALFAEDGTLQASAAREYAVEIPRATWAEQDAERVWALAREALSETLQASGIPRVIAIGLSVQGEAVIPVDGRGNALRPAILGMDTRTGLQNDWLRARFGADYLFQHTGMPVHTINTLPKLLWLKEHEPAIWDQAAQFSLYEDFLVRKMTGQAIISQCLASRTQLVAIASGDWSDPVLEALGLARERLAAIGPSGQVAGTMDRRLAEQIGFAEPPLVVLGGHDQACGALGVGVTRPGLAMVSTGTAEVVEVALDVPRLSEPLYHGNISIYSHAVPDLHLAMTLNHSGGLLLRWFRDTLCGEEAALARKRGQDPHDLILAGTSLLPSSLLVLPHFAGSGTPTCDTASKGAILGLTFGTTKADLVQAILEGLTFELRVNLDLLMDEGGIPIDELRAAGGGARSRRWLQLKADITGIPVVVPRVTEAACWGAALLAGAGAGVFHDLASAAAETVQWEGRLEPDAERKRAFDARYDLYRQVYPAVAPISHRM
jgi:xylulokinase